MLVSYVSVKAFASILRDYLGFAPAEIFQPDFLKSMLLKCVSIAVKLIKLLKLRQFLRFIIDFLVNFRLFA